MKRRLISLCLTIAMLAMACVPVLATADVSSNGQEVQATLTATLAESNLEVTVPTSIAFSLDPAIDVENPDAGKVSCNAQVTQPTVKIINGSLFDIAVGIKAFSLDNGLHTTGFIDSSTPKGYIMFELCAQYEAGDATSLLQKYDFVNGRMRPDGYDITIESAVDGGEIYPLNPDGGKIKAAVKTDSGVVSPNEAPLHILARATWNTLAGIQSFKADVTFVVYAASMVDSSPWNWIDIMPET